MLYNSMTDKMLCVVFALVNDNDCIINTQQAELSIIFFK